MTLASHCHSELPRSVAGLAEIAEEITRRLEAGESLQDSRIEELWPGLASEVRRLLPALRSLADLERPPAAAGGERGIDAGVSGVLGEFRTLREIGRGGMGIVYEAEQSSLGRKVALKVLPSAASLDERAHQRFRLESQAAALLVHPNIVPVYTVGEHGGLPYYAMQFIEGRNLAEILSALRLADRGEADPPASPQGRDERAETLASLLIHGRLATEATDPADLRAEPPAPSDPCSTGGPGSRRSAIGQARGFRIRSYIRAVVRLAVQSANALQYAHEQGIVHRDVKPANLMLDSRGKLWLTDFGLARIASEDGLTRTGDLPGTLRYMSPEQAQGGASPIDPRSDVYSLGATLYEMLTLRPAIGGSDRYELLRNIAEAVPRPIRQDNPSVPKDLATIVARCLTKDPAGRYDSARALAEDLTRFLESRPILAQPVGRLEATVRWCRRKPELAAAVSALVLSLLAGMVGVSLGWREAVHQRDLLDVARRQANLERDLKERQRLEAEAARVRAEVAERQAEEAAEAARAVTGFLNEKILLKANPAHTPSQRKLTLLEVVDRASDDVGNSFPGKPLVEAEIRSMIGSTFHALGEYAKAEQHTRKSYELYRQQLGEEAERTCHEGIQLGHLLEHLDRRDEGGTFLRRIREITGRSFPPEHPIVRRLNISLGDLEQNLGHLAEAEVLYRAALAAIRGKSEIDATHASSVRYRLAHSLMMQGRHDEAEPLFRDSVEIARSNFGAQSATTLAAINNLGTFLQSRGRMAEAETLFRENLQATIDVHGPDHPSTLAATENLAIVLMERGAFAEAEAMLRRTLDKERASLGPENTSTLYTQGTLAGLLARTGKVGEAAELIVKTFAAQSRVLGPEHPFTIRSKLLLDRLVKSE